MGALSVQNQYQGQFGVIGSSKVRDWTSPLTPPPPPSAATNNHTTTTSISSTAALNQRNQQQQLRQQQQQQQSSLQRNGSNQYPQQQLTANNTQDVDVVDGGRAAQQQPLTKQQQQKHQQQQQHHYYHNNHHYGVTHYNHHQHQQQQQSTHLLQQHKVAVGQQAYQQQTQRVMEAVPADPTSNSDYVYNNNLFGYEDPTRFGSAYHDIDVAAVKELAQRVQAELRAAKSRHLACTEVSLPEDLMPRIAQEIIKASEREPCGVRGCALYIDFEDEPNNVRRIASFQVDPNTVSTFELYLTLKQDKSGWTSLLPQFLKNLTRSNTILISPAFTLIKNKLYACD